MSVTSLFLVLYAPPAPVTAMHFHPSVSMSLLQANRAPCVYCFFLYPRISFWLLSAINTLSHYAEINLDSKKNIHYRTADAIFVWLVWLLELTFYRDKSCQNRQIPVCKGDNPNIKYETFEPMCIRTSVFMPSIFNRFNYGTPAML